VIARIEELDGIRTDPDSELDDDETEELGLLRSLAVEGEGASEDWPHGAALIRDSYFEEYARDLADDIGAVNADATWPNTHIDWPAAARDLQTDYTSVTYDAVTYWTR
jgi:antirestriction protein